MLLEGLSELRIKDGVDERVDAAIDVAQPRGQHEGGVARAPRELQLYADGVEDVASEEWHPANQETAWIR